MQTRWNLNWPGQQSSFRHFKPGCDVNCHDFCLWFLLIQISQNNINLNVPSPATCQWMCGIYLQHIGWSTSIVRWNDYLKYLASATPPNFAGVTQTQESQPPAPGSMSWCHASSSQCQVTSCYSPSPWECHPVIMSQSRVRTQRMTNKAAIVELYLGSWIYNDVFYFQFRLGPIINPIKCVFEH